MREEHFRTILGIRFFTGRVEEALALSRRGGVVLVPSGPGLADLPADPAYREALENCDLALMDSGFMVLCWRLKTGERLERLSGLKFLSHFLEDTVFREGNRSFWVMPDEKEDRGIRAWLGKRGLMIRERDRYIAPIYGDGTVEDRVLLARLRERRPSHIMINIGGGAQEKLGYFLKRELDYNPAIICTGAAIAFLSGLQAPISPLVDRLLLGWLVRCLHAPGKFIPRYWRARRLFYLIWKYGEKSPVGEMIG